jgi:hypothetical protein
MMTTRRRCVTAWSTETILRHQRRSKPLEFGALSFMSNGRLTVHENVPVERKQCFEKTGFLSQSLL